MNQKLYKREGRRFVQTNITIPINRVGMYYQNDKTFVKERTKDSIGLCIISTFNEHIVMMLQDEGEGFKQIRHEVAEKILQTLNKNSYNKIDFPKFIEFIEAFKNFRDELQLIRWKGYWGPSTSYILADSNGYASYDAATSDGYFATLRPVIRIKQ